MSAPGKYTGYHVRVQTHAERAQAVDALDHRHTFGLPARSLSETMGADYHYATTIEGCGCGSTGSYKSRKKVQMADQASYSSDASDRSDSESDREVMNAQSTRDVPEVGESPSVEASSAPQMGEPASSVETSSAAPVTEAQYVMLGDQSEAKAEEKATQIEEAVAKFGSDFEQQPPLSEHFIRGFQGLVVAGAFDDDSSFRESATTIVREKMIAGDSAFRSTASAMLGEENCVDMFATVDKALEAPEEDSGASVDPKELNE